MADLREKQLTREANDAEPTRSRRPRGSMSPDDMIDGAFELAEKVGIAKLSMPALARHLDIPVTSIYWHFRRREQLLDAMMDRAADEYHFATPFVGDEPWDLALRNHFCEMRKVFAENPLLCDLMLMRANQYSQEASVAAVAKLEAVIEKLVAAGFSPDNALEVYLALSVHSRGSAMLEHLHSQPVASGKKARKPLPDSKLIRQLVSTAGITAHTPLLMELAGRGHAVTDINFEFTLEALIDRARALLAADQARAGQRSRKK